MSRLIVFVVSILSCLPMLAQDATVKGMPLKVRCLMGLENIKRNSRGTLAMQNDSMQFTAGQAVVKVPVKSIDDIFSGEEMTQSGGTVGTITKVALPYGGGRALSLLLRSKIDILTLTYRDDNGGFHGDPDAAKGARDASPRAACGWRRARHRRRSAAAAAGEETMIRRSVIVASAMLFGSLAQAEDKSAAKPSTSAIRIEQVDAGDVTIPMEFRVAIYESLLDRVRQSAKFKQVYRSGDRQADGVQDLVTLKTKIEKFQEGSQTKREVTTVSGATKVDVSATVVAKDGRVLLEQNLTGKVRFFGENLGATNDLAKRIAKLLREKM